MQILVCSAHPDDETLGAGGSLIRWAGEGHEIHWLIATRAWEPQWPRSYLDAASKQIAAAAERLGVAHVHRLGFPAAATDTVPQYKLNDEVGAVIRSVAPERLLTVWSGDVHADHRAVADAVMVATRPYPGQPVREVLAYETASSSEWGTAPFPANVYVDISRQIDRKLDALAAYASEAKEPPHPRSLDGVRARAALRGYEVGTDYAEAFHLIRSIR